MSFIHKIIIQPLIIIVNNNYDITSLGNNIKNRLKELRKKKKLTQVALQMQTGIEQALLSKFENGERTPPTETLFMLAEFYSVSIDYILCRTDNPEINR
ncbi:MAG: helix-turn-helix transcriptional regulator [Clostridia bacterium]|nr:helix-turn-helix transcriptional regulator [Clostridia bacterium]